ncbi:hypothetical protein ABZ614_07525 [Streptomyces sp. NPDC013178]|uniref:hypothetical protein n=1 Tax=Streptomyces sp. NPDC013178 TaxID=3155118 RepID=UPI0033E6A44B
MTAIASAGITAASSVLDRRRTYGLLRLAGTPLRILDEARRKEALIPVAVLAGGAVLTGLFTPPRSPFSAAPPPSTSGASPCSPRASASASRDCWRRAPSAARC